MADVTVIDPDLKWTYRNSESRSKSRNSPFDGWEFLGRAVAPGLLIAFLVGTIVGLGIMARKGVAEGRKTAVPFGPFLCFGALVALFYGDDIVDWYLDTFAAGA